MQPYLYLLKGHFKAETLIEVRIEGVFLDRRLLLLDPLPILLQDDLHVRIFEIRQESGIALVRILYGSVVVDNCRRVLSAAACNRRQEAESPDKPPTSIFFRFFASMMFTVSFPAVGT